MEKRKINVSIEKTRDAGEENKETPKGSGKQERRNERWREKKEKETVARGRGERSPDGRTKLDAEPRDEAAKPARKVNRADKRERAQPGAQDGNRPKPAGAAPRRRPAGGNSSKQIGFAEIAPRPLESGRRQAHAAEEAGEGRAKILGGLDVAHDKISFLALAQRRLDAAVGHHGRAK